MAGVILAILDRPEAVPALLTAAARLAALAGNAAVETLLVRGPPATSIEPSEEVLTPRRAAQVRAVEERRALALTASVDAWVRRTGHPVRLIDVEDLSYDAVAARGAAADFVAIMRPATRPGMGPGTRSTEAAERALRAALLATGRPVLVVPPGRNNSDFGRTVAVAWRDDGRAVQAVLPALRLLPAGARVHVLQGTDGDPELLAMPALFREHGIDAVLHPLRVAGEFGRALLDRAHAVGADLLVMGAYGHMPLREAIFGGVTRFMLAHADLPVLMRH